MNIYPYWFESQKKLLFIYAENILAADNEVKSKHNLNPIHSVLKNLKITFADLTNNKVIVVRGLDKKGVPIQSPYPSRDEFELIARGGIYKTFTIHTLEEFNGFMKTTPKFNFSKVSLSVGDIPLTWGFTLQELNKKFSVTYS